MVQKKKGLNKKEGGRKMKKAFLKKMMVCIIFLMVLITLLQVNSLAKSEEIQIIKLKNKNEYILYISGLAEEKFEFAFSNNSNVDDESLAYMDSAKDEENGNNIAYIDENMYNTYFKDKDETYLFVKKENTEAKTVKIELSSALSEEDIQDLNQITKKINIEIGKKELPTETNKDGVKINHTIGTIKITDDKESSYMYKLVKITAGSNTEKLAQLIKDLNSSSERSMIEKLSLYNNFKELYTSLKPSENDKNWQKVENYTIEQPEDSKKGDQYLVWIQKDSKEGTIIDLQVMNCSDEYTPSYEDKDIVIKQTSKLPITYDNVILFIIAGILLVAIIAIVILKVKNKKDEK